MKLNTERDDRVYRTEDKPINKKLGRIKCPKCGKLGTHMERRGKEFYVRFCECKKCKKISPFKKVIEDKYKIGDRIRYYEKLSYGKNAKIDFETYIEGKIVSKEKFIIDYLLNIIVEKKVYKNEVCHIDKEEVYIGISSSSNLVELLN